MEYQDFLDESRDWRDDSGHGTHLAVLLRKIAPNAIVHVARVFKENPTESTDAIAKVSVCELKKKFLVNSTRQSSMLQASGRST